MAFDIYSTQVLNAVVASLLGESQFLVDRYFANVQTDAAENISFDQLDGKRRVSPFVSPLVEGQIVSSLGYKTSTFKPAYIKDKRVFDMNRPLKRAPGEQIGGSMTPINRLRALIAQDMQDQLAMLRRRLEVMAGSVLATGKCTITGDKYPTVVLDFGRTSTPPPAITWDQPTAKPLTDIEGWAMTILQATGAMPRDVIMTVDAWNAFTNNSQVTSQLDRYRTMVAPPSLTNEAPITEGGVFMGMMAGFNIYVYSAWYVDPADGAEKPVLPAGTAILCSSAIEGYQAYGAIRDEEAGLQAVPYFVKSWIEPDPSVRFVMMQSAPLVVPYRIGASAASHVLP